ncbi:hypothetical protein [uncultured Enterovirga sp.]|uniref:hypothetical protein n=1 Tax=uncultured Enterovirga sp. TaxID=2026352 RepID=UPI0035CB7D9D
MTYLTTDQNLAIALTLVGIFFGWLFTFIYFRKAQPVRGLCYASTKRRFLSYSYERTERFRITFDGQDVFEPISESAYIWNFGTETINNSDISASDPLRYGSERAIILTASLSQQSRPSISASVTLSADHHYAIIDFDFLDNDDGIVLDLTYDRADRRGHEPYPLLVGSIKGIKGGPRPTELTFARNGNFGRVILAPAGLATAAAVVALIGYDVYATGIWSILSMAKIVAATALGVITLISTGVWLISFESSGSFVLPDGLRPLRNMGSDFGQKVSGGMDSDTQIQQIEADNPHAEGRAAGAGPA